MTSDSMLACEGRDGRKVSAGPRSTLACSLRLADLVLQARVVPVARQSRCQLVVFVTEEPTLASRTGSTALQGGRTAARLLSHQRAAVHGGCVARPGTRTVDLGLLLRSHRISSGRRSVHDAARERERESRSAEMGGKQRSGQKLTVAARQQQQRRLGRAKFGSDGFASEPPASTTTASQPHLLCLATCISS